MTDSTVALSQPLYGASLVQAVKRFFAKYATFSGRASRSEYWWVAVAFLIVSVVFGGILALVLATTGEVQPGGGVKGTGPEIAVLVIFGLLYLAVIIPSISVTVRRLHDANFSGWLYLLHLIPYLGSLIVLILTILPSRPEGVRFDA